MSEWSASVADVTDAAKAGAGNKAVVQWKQMTLQEPNLTRTNCIDKVPETEF